MGRGEKGRRQMDGTGGGTEVEKDRMSEGETSGGMCGEEKETEGKEGNEMWRNEERK